MSPDESGFIPSILIVDGNEEHCALLVDLFTRDGYRVTHVEDGLAALKKIDAQHFDLVVTGVLMVRMDGLELLRVLRETVSDLPVIVVSDAVTQITEVYLRCAELLGAVQTHLYPLDPDTLLNGARQAIRQNRIKLVGN